VTLSHGYDFSAYQGNTVPKGAFGWVKTSEGDSYRNSKFKAQWASAQANWEAPGVYHYAHPEQSSAVYQVNMVASMVRLTAGKHTVMLDLEASELSQPKTNDWAKRYSDALRTTFPGVPTVLYAGSGYATNGTGKGLADFFDFWCFPRYPSAYRLPAALGAMTLDEARAVNRSNLGAAEDLRILLSAPKSNWPTSMDEMPMPSGARENTGFTDNTRLFWQFTDNHTPGKIDASVSSMTAAQILGGGTIPQLEEKEMPGDVPPLHLDERYTYTGAAGAVNVWGIGFDSPEKLTYRIAAHKKAGKGVVKSDLVVGGPASTSDSWPKKATWSIPDTDIDWWSMELIKCEGPTPDWDPTKPDRNGKIVRPFWDASHTK
jgi:hypothetical protein